MQVSNFRSHGQVRRVRALGQPASYDQGKRYPSLDGATSGVIGLRCSIAAHYSGTVSLSTRVPLPSSYQTATVERVPQPPAGDRRRSARGRHWPYLRVNAP